MESSYSFALKTIEFEGGYVNNPSDIGGETKFGISKKFHPDVDIKNLTKDDAVRIYLSTMAYVKEIPSILSSGFAFLYFDCRVSGQKYSVMALQNIVNSLFAPDERVVVDGIWGPKTTALLNKVDVSMRIPVLKACLSIAEGVGRAQAMHTMRAQERSGLKVQDFSNGYIRRCRERLIAAIEFERSSQSL